MTRKEPGERPGANPAAPAGPDENYRALARAVCMQAVRDWKLAKERLRRNPENRGAQRLLEDTERFFLSDWFRILAGMDGEWILSRLLDWRLKGSREDDMS